MRLLCTIRWWSDVSNTLRTCIALCTSPLAWGFREATSSDPLMLPPRDPLHFHPSLVRASCRVAVYLSCGKSHSGSLVTSDTRHRLCAPSPPIGWKEYVRWRYLYYSMESGYSFVGRMSLARNVDLKNVSMEKNWMEKSYVVVGPPYSVRERYVRVAAIIIVTIAGSKNNWVQTHKKPSRFLHQ